MSTEILDFNSTYCPVSGPRVDEKSDCSFYDLWLSSATAGEESHSLPPQPLVATTITMEAIQSMLWANGFPIDPPPAIDVGPGPFEDTQFDVVVDVETTDNVETTGDVEATDYAEGDEQNVLNSKSPSYESELSEEDLSILPADIPLSPVLSVKLSESDFDFNGCDSGIEAEFDEYHEESSGVTECHDEKNFSVADKVNTASLKGCQSCLQNRDITTSQDNAKIIKNTIKKSNNGQNNKEESLDFKCQYLWEFLQYLLADSKYHNCIVWKNERRGIFRLTDHQRVASLWGRLKRRKNMTYDKLSRALRYYYSKNILKKVEGQRLTYKFCKNLDGKKFAS